MRKDFTLSLAMLLSFLIFFEGSFHFHDAQGESFASDAEHCFLCSTMGSMEAQGCDSGGGCEFFDTEVYIAIEPNSHIPLSGQASFFAIRAPPLS